MKNFFTSLAVLFFLFSCCSPARAANPVNKLARGIINIPTSLIEIPYAYRRSKERLDAFSQKYPEEFLTPTVNTPYQYLIKAPLTGIAAMVGRICIGCYDVVTFPFSLPRYYAPVYEPEFVFDTMPYAFKIYNQGVTYMDRGRYRRAIARFTQALKVDPTNAQALYNRGRAYDMIDQYRRSVDDLNAAESLGFHPELENIKSPDNY
ncbi:MAG: tetratricopeptide repeat protein [Candidatus Omnitrophota bacterium]